MFIVYLNSQAAGKYFFTWTVKVLEQCPVVEPVDHCEDDFRQKLPRFMKKDFKSKWYKERGSLFSE